MGVWCGGYFLYLANSLLVYSIDKPFSLNKRIISRHTSISLFVYLLCPDAVLVGVNMSKQSSQ